MTLGDVRLPPEREIPWRPQAMVRVGISVLALDEPVSLALAELEAAADEPLPDDAAPPAPPSSVAVASVAPPPAPSAPGPATAAAPAPAPVDGSRTATTVVRRKRRVWTMADVMVVTVAALVIGASLAGLAWVLR